MASLDFSLAPQKYQGVTPGEKQDGLVTAEIKGAQLNIPAQLHSGADNPSYQHWGPPPAKTWLEFQAASFSQMQLYFQHLGNEPAN